MNKLAPLLLGAFGALSLLSGCGSDPFSDEACFCPEPPVAPAETPVHFVVEGLVDVWLPTDESRALARYFPGPDPAPLVNAQVWVGDQSSPIFGWGFVVYVESGATTVTPPLVYESLAYTKSGTQVEVELTSGTIEAEAFSLTGEVEVGGAVREISVDGPFYRTCWRMDGSKDPNPNPAYGNGYAPWSDPDFGGDCAPFKE